MREVVSVQLGQCGNQIGSKFWEIISNEHDIDVNGQLKEMTEDSSKKNAKPEVFFSFIESNSRYIPRTLFVDTEPGAIYAIQSSEIGELFSPDNFIFGHSATGNNWAKGHYKEGTDLLDSIFDILHHEIELCDSLDAIQIIHSLGGGTGSGLGTLLLGKLKEEYPDLITATYSVIPSPKVSDVVVESYNTVLSMNQLIENANECFILDNEALYDISKRSLHREQPTYHDLNHLISLAISGITSSLRFPGQVNCDYRNLSVKLIPLPRLHFFTISYSPLIPLERIGYHSLNCQEMISQLFHSNNVMCAVNPRHGQYLGCAIFMQGKHLSVEEIDEEMLKLTSLSSPQFVDWIPNNVLVSLSNVSPTITIPTVDYKHDQPYRPYQCATMVANSTAINEVWRRVLDQYSAMFRRKAYIHWYLSEGMEEEEFIESEKNLQDLISEYTTYQQNEKDIINIHNEDQKNSLPNYPEDKKNSYPNYPEEIYP